MFTARLVLRGYNQELAQMYNEEPDLMTNYEISTGTYKEDLVDFNIIQLINKRREIGLSVDYFEIETNLGTAKNISDLVRKVYSKTKLELPYSIHSKHIVEFYEEDFIVAVIPNFDLRTMRIDAYGAPEKIIKWRPKFEKAFPNRADAIKMSWYYSNGRGFESTEIPISTDDVSVNDSYYPYIECGVDAYLDSYHNSKNSILLLVGEPGTGKTSFIRYYLSRYMLDSMVTYDENVMNRDDFYINFLTNSKKHILIVEDADLLLAARADGENKIMSKFLNVSDGLVKALNKKIIFSTNITELDRIDSAIVRPGRCFDILEFRKLTREEANVICEQKKLPLFEQQGEYSLADVFNRTPRTTRKIRKAGFLG